jgi:hypothetical protein
MGPKTLEMIKDASERRRRQALSCKILSLSDKCNLANAPSGSLVESAATRERLDMMSVDPIHGQDLYDDVPYMDWADMAPFDDANEEGPTAEHDLQYTHILEGVEGPLLVKKRWVMLFY